MSPTRTASTTNDRPTTTPDAATTSGDAPRPLVEIDEGVQATTTETIGAAAPSISPPGMMAPAPLAAAAAAVTGTWQVDKRCTAMWTNGSPRNAWLHIDGIGWKKIKPATDSAVVSMTAIGSLARQTGARLDYVEETDGTISQLVIW
jgi:hypothetical protein